MLNDFLNPKFEIEITNRNGRTEAFCPVFPDCFGIGGSEKEAIEDLADSIALYLGEVVKTTVNDIVRGGVLRHVEPVKEIKSKIEEKIKTDQKKNKQTFVFPDSIKTDKVKFEKLFSTYHKKPIMRSGVLSVLGLNSLSSPLSMEKKDFDFTSDFIENFGAEDRGPEGILLGIPLSFN